MRISDWSSDVCSSDLGSTHQTTVYSRIHLTRMFTDLRVFCVRPAWAHSCGCKSRHKLITANEAKRNCVRVTGRGKEAWSISCEPMNKNRIEGAAEQGERARNSKAPVHNNGRAGCRDREGP